MTTRALVLGGGGITGIAWELGLLAGLAQRGLDVTRTEGGVDRVVGTSAGSVVGAQILGDRTLAELFEGQLAPPDGEIAARFGTSVMARMAVLALLPGSPTAKRRRIGRAAIKAHPESADQRLRVIAERIGADATWPERDLRVIAVSAVDGASRVFTRDSGVGLVPAVAASCAVPLVWPPVPIDGVAYVDGGVRSIANADLAAGSDVVLVLAPAVYATSRFTSLTAQLARTGAARSLVLKPDVDAAAAMGKNALDPSHRADAARAGFRQAEEVLDDVERLWS